MPSPVQSSYQVGRHAFFQPPPRDRGRKDSNGKGLPRLRSVEAAKLIEHQMYFWGRDVLHSDGNLLVAAGCQRFRHANCSHAVRCYRLETPEAVITLHSTGISLQGIDGEPGVVYLRPTHRLYHLNKGARALPYSREGLRSVRRVLPHEFPAALTSLLAFVWAYEQWAGTRCPPGSRLTAWREQKVTATKGVRWLKPEESMRWLDACLAARKEADPDRYLAPDAFEFPARP